MYLFIFLPAWCPCPVPEPRQPPCKFAGSGSQGVRSGNGFGDLLLTDIDFTLLPLRLTFSINRIGSATHFGDICSVLYLSPLS